MSPVRTRKSRPSTATSLDFLNNVSRVASHKPSRDESVWDIPSSPEPPKTSPRISQPTPSPLRRPRTRSHRDIPSPEPHAIEEQEIEQPTPDAIDDQDEEEVGFFPGEIEDEQISGSNDSPVHVEMPDPGNQALYASDNSDDEELVLFSSEGEEEVEEEEENYYESETNENGQLEEAPGDNSSVFSRNSRQVVPSRSNIEVVIENEPEHSYLSHGYAETIISDVDGQHQEEMAEQVVPEQQQQRRIDPDVQYIRELRHWFVREVKKTSMEQDWNKLNESGRALKQNASRPRPDYLEDLHQLFAEYRNLYKEAVEPQNLTSSRRFWTQLRNVKKYILADVRQLFEQASETLQDASILDQFEAHFVPKMTILTQLGFKAYRETDGNAHGQLYDTLDLLSVCIGLIKNYVGLLEPAFRSRNLIYSLRRVMKALETGQLRANRPSPRNGNQPGITILPRIDDWTLNEERALRSGMVKYVDSETPFLLIAKYLGHKFQRRSIRDMEGKARALGLI